MRKAIILFYIFATVLEISAQNPETRIEHFNLEENKVALSGYDPLTYFINNPHKGFEKYAYSYKGVTYHFISEKSREIFSKNPEKYEPQYGGWGAYALTKDKPDLMEVDPKTYKIKDGKLYLFYNNWGINMKKKWDKDEQKNTIKANSFWKELIKQ